ncbi:hypothetical protein DUI87_01110 [Hirundo rustica rustica]|uniref:Reverse transcriptase domain-containing protein n=1 Tax=Hirundo rustica rustica TaxID=333673 RepID=A0A3M0L8J6_HIRRU|nr:hypothetical protein DUI87_01110 [Hirundo rustica rustica]
MEKIILGAIEKHLKDNTVIGHSQHGFIRGKSCLSNIISSNDKVTHIVDQGKRFDEIFLNFSKAFDIVPNSNLLDKMSSTQLDKHITPGLEDILRKFADNTKLGGAVYSFEGREALQRDLNKLEDWAITNHMKFDKGKCQILHLGWGNPDRLGNEKLESSGAE